jgi:ADP-dependent NAD(P)H-hydrate dehydratase / NAD(P)H-hydrate epimerase
MEKADQTIFNNFYKPAKDSHKGQNGKLTIIGGSQLFHGASLWALKTASRIVDMVFYATVKENEELTKNLQSQLYDFICVPRKKVAEYIDESDAVLIGPGMVRGSKNYTGTGESGQQTSQLTKKLLFKFPDKKWIIDAGALQALEAGWLLKLKQVAITPHFKEFAQVFKLKNSFKFKPGIKDLALLVRKKAAAYNCTIVLKGKADIICSADQCFINTTGNEGMTKGGTGDVLAGLIAALACKNDLLKASVAGIYVNGLAGDELYKKVGPYFNASDLADMIPYILKKLMKQGKTS